MQQRILKSAFNLNTTALGFILMLLLSLVPLRALAYELVLLGDLHYDAQNLHTAAYFEQHKSQHQRTLSRNLSSWEGAAPSHALLEEAGQASEQSLFAIQVGDFAHGHAGSQALAAKMYAQVLKLLKANFKVPVYITPGNHEYAGAGASSALKATLQPYLSSLLPEGERLDDYNYTLEQENDVFIFFNCIRPDLDFLKQQLTAHATARYTFVITHYPVLPIARGDLSFLLYGKSEEQQKREELLNLLCEHNVIVLCGHIHEQTLLEYENEHGLITQLTAYSLFDSGNEAKEDRIISGSVSLFKKRKAVRAALAAGGYTAKLLQNTFPYLTRYTKLSGAGYVRLILTESGVNAEFFCQDPNVPLYSLKLR